MRGIGENFPIQDPERILEIDSPRENLDGPYTVVFTSIEERWSIVTISWDGQPRLGIRWFWSRGGNPISSGHATWLVVPPSLTQSMLISLPIAHQESARIDDFLSGRISGAEIRGK